MQRMPITVTKEIVAPTLTGLVLASAAWAGHNGEDHFWAGPLAPEVGTFGDDGNWSEGVAPGEGDAAIFNQPGAFEVTFDADHTNDRLLVNRGQVTFDLAGRTYELTNPLGAPLPERSRYTSPSGQTTRPR